MIKERVIRYAEKQYSTLPESPFSSSPNTIVFRHKRNRKWYGVIMSVAKNKLGLDSELQIELICVKLNPELIDILRNKEGYYPAYHMNKEHWISIVLDGTISSEEICSLLDDSYYLTK